jgi:kynurenine formamidase
VGERRAIAADGSELAGLHPLREALSLYRMVDLSVVLSEDMPSWPGHMPYTHKVHNWYERVSTPGQALRSTAAYYTCWMTIDEHCGTHFDAPPHFVPPPDSGLLNAGELGAVYGHQVGLEQLQGPAVVVDVRELNDGARDGVSPRITPAFLANWERRHGAIEPGEVVLCHSGWDRYWAPPPDGAKYCHRPVVLGDFPGWPAPSAEAIEYLFDRGVRLVATDGPSVGAVDEQESMHYAGLTRNLLYVECLSRLGELPTRGAYFVFMPLKIEQSSGGNGRAMAFVPR